MNRCIGTPRLPLVPLIAVAMLGAACGAGGGAERASATTYLVTYDGNGSTGGAVPVDPTRYEQGQSVTVLANSGSLTRTAFTFAGWSTQPDGGGSTYLPAQTFAMGAADTTLYAKWTANPSYTVTYDGNGSTGGTVPVDPARYEQSQAVAVQENLGWLVKTSFVFMGWNTEANGSGSTFLPGQTLTMGTADATLYARWDTPVSCGGFAGLSCPAGQFCDIQGCSNDTGTCVLVPMSCNTTLAQVCGCNAITYQNDCARVAAAAALDHAGACP